MLNKKVRSKVQIKKQFAAFTLTELMVVLVIIGILILLALPRLTGLFAQAYSLEAQRQLQYINALQEMYYQRNFRYANNLTELRFEPPKLKRDGGDALYIYSIANASKNGFVARAEASEDFDKDGTLNIWEISQEQGSLKEVVLD
ncbi:MAG: type IV pilin protein [Saprospiraceae bacterium]|nr:type IV pilin protein [Saprospiraceae bacterium]